MVLRVALGRLDVALSPRARLRAANVFVRRERLDFVSEAIASRPQPPALTLRRIARAHY